MQTFKDIAHYYLLLPETETMTKTELTTGTLLFVEVPNDGNPFNTGITAKNPLPDGNWELLGLSHELTEDQLSEVMDAPLRIPNPTNPYCVEDIAYKSFLNDEYFHTALESFNSLKQSLNLEETKTYAVLFKGK
jgi:hypothetical protein